VGIWYLNTGYAAGYIHIAPMKETGYLDIIGISSSPEELVKWMKWYRARAYASEIDGQIYHNVKRLSGIGDDYTPPEENPGLIIVRADVSEEDTLIVRSHTVNSSQVVLKLTFSEVA
jgi:hypothetical protein